jgi:hypothetical protein
MNEVTLFITDPADGKKKFVGSKQMKDDGTLVWFRRINSEHVMRSGTFGVDAMTYDMHFAGKQGKFRVSLGDLIYECPFDVFEAHRTSKDHGHGNQYFLAFSYWVTDHVVPTVSPVRKTTAPKLVFGMHRPCGTCAGKSIKKQAECQNCGGTGVVTT